ncbi:MAG: fluoride efflux transporter CrcB [Bacteroidales bacterium]
MLKYALIIGTGGFIGSISRYLVSRLVQDNFHSNFPLGTFVVNISGCLLIGLIVGIAEKSTWMSPEWRLFLMVGLCGGFTTFSTFAAENFSLMRDGQYFQVLLYTGFSVFFGFIAVFLGHMFTKLF